MRHRVPCFIKQTYSVASRIPRNPWLSLCRNCCWNRCFRMPVQLPLGFVMASQGRKAEIFCAMQRLAPLQIHESKCSSGPGVVVLKNFRATTFVQTNEQCSGDSVKPVMDRTRIALASFLPALWILLCGQSLPAQCIDCAKESSTFQTCTLQKGKHLSSGVVSSTDITARRATPRPGKPDHSNPPILDPISRVHKVEQAPLAICSARRESTLALATCWQFACRTALEPRAPSSDS